jgi:hypothetical protein
VPLTILQSPGSPRTAVLGHSQPKLSKLAFCRLCPSTSTHAKEGDRPPLCHPDWSGPGFPKSQYRTRCANANYAGQEIRGSVREGPAVSLGPHANADKRSTNPTRFSLKLTRFHTINELPAHQTRYWTALILSRPCGTGPRPGYVDALQQRPRASIGTIAGPDRQVTSQPKVTSETITVD